MAPHVIRWGCISTGNIAMSFCKDLLVDPSTRGTTDVQHKLVAIGSRSTESANNFINKLKSLEAPFDWGVKQGGGGVMDEVKGYGSYDEVYNDPNVDAIYIGTPHNFHYENAKGALLGGKNVLCEKCFTIDLAELDDLLAIAKKQNKFLMEAVWTRFHPLGYKVQELLFSGKLGKVKRFASDFSMQGDLEKWGPSHRMLNPDLAGGSLLDQGPYPSVWAMLLLYQHPDNKSTAPKLVSSYQQLWESTKVDQNSRWLLEWTGLGGVMANLMTDMNTKGYKESTCLVQCEKADIAIEWPPFRPERFNIIPHAGDDAASDIKRESFHYPVAAGGGWHYQADEVARCLRDGKIESERMPWEESRVVQGWLDQVRKEGQSVLKDLKGKA